MADSPDAASDLPLLTDDAALAAAAPVLAAAGVSTPPRVLAGAGGQSGTAAVVVADPAVAGLPTSGLRSVVDVDTQGVLGATGWLGDLSTDGDYPVVSAQTAFDRLDAMPRALADIACPEIAPGPMESPADDPMPLPCKVDPLVITGATFGLMLSWEDAEPDPRAGVAVHGAGLGRPDGAGGCGRPVPRRPGTAARADHRHRRRQRDPARPGHPRHPRGPAVGRARV